MKLTTIRITAFDLYDSCPYCFFLAQSGVKQVANPNMAFGTLIHKGIEEYHRFGKKVFDPSRALYLKVYSEMYKETKDPEEKIEWKFAVPFERTGITITGTVDRIKDEWIFDHKTSSARWTQEQADNNKQVSGYSWGYRQIFGKSERGIRFNVLVKNKTPLLVPVDTYRTDEDIKKWKEWIYGILDNIAADKFDPKPGRFHNFKSCPMVL